MSLSDVLFKSALSTKIAGVAGIKGGVMKDFVLRTLAAQDEPWWMKNASEWKVTIMHPRCRENDYPPTFWEDEALSLCTHDVTMSNFGMSFLDLMDLDPGTFERIREKVHQVEERQQAAMPKELKEQLEEAKKKAK